MIRSCSILLVPTPNIIETLHLHPPDLMFFNDKTTWLMNESPTILKFLSFAWIVSVNNIKDLYIKLKIKPFDISSEDRFNNDGERAAFIETLLTESIKISPILSSQ